MAPVASRICDIDVEDTKKHAQERVLNDQETIMMQTDLLGFRERKFREVAIIDENNLQFEAKSTKLSQ